MHGKMLAIGSGRGRLMELNDISKITSGNTGALGFIVAALIAGIVSFRKYFRGEKVAEAGVNAEISIITRLSDQLDKANLRADLAESRADTANRERNEMVRELGDIKEKMGQLTAEVRLLKEIINVQTA